MAALVDNPHTAFMDFYIRAENLYILPDWNRYTFFAVVYVNLFAVARAVFRFVRCHAILSIKVQLYTLD